MTASKTPRHACAHSSNWEIVESCVRHNGASGVIVALAHKDIEHKSVDAEKTTRGMVFKIRLMCHWSVVKLVRSD